MLSQEWLSAFAPVGSRHGSNQWAAAGAGVFFLNPPLLWLVTANHVVDMVGESDLSILIAKVGGGGLAMVEIGKLLAMRGLSWVRDKAKDIAVAPVPQSPDFAIKAVAGEVCLPFAEVIPSMQCYSIGCPYGIKGFDASKATPLVLDGVISGVEPSTQRIITSAPTFPGSSGGPLIAIRSPLMPGGGITIGGPTVLLAGIMLQTILVPSPVVGSQTPPLHLGVAISTDAIISLMNSDQAKGVVSTLSGP